MSHELGKPGELPRTRGIPAFRVDPALERAKRTGSDLAPPILDTAKAYATVAEASGEYRAA